MGTGVFGGMLISTFVATIFVPMFFALVTRSRRKQDDRHAPDIVPNADRNGVQE
jgi:hypothetical protein